MKRLSHLAIATAVLCGCRSVPFREVDYVPVESVDPHGMLESFSSSLARDFEVLSTIVFEYRWHAFSVLGYLSIDSEERAFTVVCMNHVGVKILEFSVRGEEIEKRFVLEGIPHGDKLPEAVGNDIKRIYFDRIPSCGAVPTKQKCTITYAEVQGEGVVKYVFAGEEPVLVEKRYEERNHAVWTANYYEYQREQGKLYPRGIVLTHHRHGYRLVIRSIKGSYESASERDSTLHVKP